jgi:hypothetical protein
MSRRLYPAALCFALAFLALSLLAAQAAAIPAPPPLPPAHEGLAGDCIIAAALAPGSSEEVDWTVWCGPTPGRYRVELRAPADGPAVAWGRAPRIGGPGTAGRPRCAAGHGEEDCRLRESGPVTARGSFRVDGDACDDTLTVRIRSIESGAVGQFEAEPWGCPGSEPTQPPQAWRTYDFYRDKDLRPAIGGDGHKVASYARMLRRKWIREAPVERWSAKALGAPTTAAALAELALRQELIRQAAAEIERWVAANGLQSTYAGWAWDPSGKVYVGFTEEAEATLARLKAEEPFVAPERVMLIPTPPRHTLIELEELAGQVVARRSEATGLHDTYGGVAYDVLANKVEVFCQEGAVAETATFLAEHFAADAPLEIVETHPAPP